MAILFMESFDHYTSPSLPAVHGKWSQTRNSGGISLITGRFGQAWYGFESRWTRKDFPNNYTTWIAGCAFAYAGGGDTTEFITFAEQSSSISHVCLRWNPVNNHLEVMRNSHSSPTILGYYPWTPSLYPTWYFIEMKATCDDTTGSVEVRIDGATVINLTGVDTKNGGAGVFNRLVLGNAEFSSDDNNAVIDDLYLLDNSGGSPTNDFLGDCRVEVILPNGNGNSSQFVGSDSDSTDNYLLVDDASPDDDTTYVESATVGNKDTYAYNDLVVTTGTVYGVQILPYARKSDAGTRKFCTVTRLSGTEVDSADQTLSTTYNYFPVVQEAKPGGGVWTIADVNNAEFGEKVTV